MEDGLIERWSRRLKYIHNKARRERYNITWTAWRCERDDCDVERDR